MRYWVLEGQLGLTRPYSLAFKDVTAPTYIRSMIAAMIPRSRQGNTLPSVSSDWGSARDEALLLANFNNIPFDWVARQKLQGQHLNWFIVEQLPVVPPGVFQSVSFGAKSAAEVVREAVLELTYVELTYVSRDMAPFARDMGFVDVSGEPRPHTVGTHQGVSHRAPNSMRCSSICTESPIATTWSTSTRPSPRSSRRRSRLSARFARAIFACPT